MLKYFCGQNLLFFINQAGAGSVDQAATGRLFQPSIDLAGREAVRLGHWLISGHSMPVVYMNNAINNKLTLIKISSVSTVFLVECSLE